MSACADTRFKECPRIWGKCIFPRRQSDGTLAKYLETGAFFHNGRPLGVAAVGRHASYTPVDTHGCGGRHPVVLVAGKTGPYFPRRHKGRAIMARRTSSNAATAAKDTILRGLWSPSLLLTGAAVPQCLPFPSSWNPNAPDAEAGGGGGSSPVGRHRACAAGRARHTFIQ